MQVGGCMKESPSSYAVQTPPTRITIGNGSYMFANSARTEKKSAVIILSPMGRELLSVVDRALVEGGRNVGNN
eukprot:5885094-Amphidinium_carterae.1